MVDGCLVKTMSKDSDLFARAVGLLARREHSRFDLGRKMQRYTDDRQAIEQVLDELEKKNLLSDERFVEVYLRSRKERFGVRRLRLELSRHQIAPEIIDRELAALQPDEFERALAVWQRRFGEPAEDRRQYARQFRFLGQRGFNAEIIRRVLEDSDAY